MLGLELLLAHNRSREGSLLLPLLHRNFKLLLFDRTGGDCARAVRSSVLLVLLEGASGEANTLQRVVFIAPEALLLMHEFIVFQAIDLLPFK